MKYNKERALELLRIGSGVPTATFRPSQEDAIAHIVEGRKGRLLVVQKTGWGKSFVYFIATKLLREGSFGPTLLISPLLSLMRDQQEAAERMGLVAWTANSSNKEDWPAIAESIKKGRIDVLMFHPKQLVSETFMRDILVPIAGNVAFLVVDEAHCISDWGHDFVPEYKIVSRTAQSLPANLRLLATTATANVRVMEDLETILGPDLVIKRGELGRPSITLQTITMKGEAERLAWLAEQLEIIPGSGIIYALTKAHVKRIVDWLQYCNIDVEAYTSDSDARPELERKLRENKLKALVATSALGMGYDKPDLTFVIHYQAPGSVVAYYQQVGRAGRAIDDAYGVILGINKEADVNKFFIDGAFPKKDEVKQVLEALNENEFGLTEREFSPCVNMSSGRINKTLLALSLESPSPIVFEDKKWQLTNSILSQTFWDTADRITQLRREELKQMREYMALDKGHMKFLVAALDGDVDGIGEPRMPNLRKSPSAERTQAATEFMRRSSLPITARAQWPAGGLPKFGVKLINKKI